MVIAALPLAVLIAVDSEDDAAQLLTWLIGDSAGAYRVATVRSGAEVLERCQQAAPGCLLLGDRLSDMCAREVLAALPRSRGLTAFPVLVVAAGADAGAAAESRRLGAEEWLDRDQVSAASLPIVVRGVVERHLLRQQLAEARALLTDLTVRGHAHTSNTVVRASSALLAEASRRLAESLEPAATLTTVTDLVVPALADLCIVDLFREDGAVERAAVIHADSAKADRAAGLQRYPPDLTRPGVAVALRTGQSECEPIVTDEMLVQIARDEVHLALLRSLAIVSHMRVPLVARGRVLGSLLLVSTEARRRYGPDDQATAEELAGRCALALDNARLHAAEEQARRRATALADATRALTEVSATPGAVLPLVARQAAILVGDLAVVRLLSGDGRWLDAVAVDHPDPAVRDEAAAAIADELHPADLGANGAAISTGRSQRVSGEALAELRRESPPGMWRPMPSTPTEALLAVPLRAEGRSIGTLSISRSSTDRQYDEDDERFLQELADRAALAAERAALLAKEQGARADAEAAVRARDQFLSIAAHELRTPTAGIKGHAQLALRALRRGTAEIDRLERGLRGIELSADRLTALIDDLLDVARLQSGQLRLRPATLDLAELVDAAVRRHRDQATGDLSLAFVSSAASVPAIGDAGRLEQVVDNLLSNALKYSPAGGQVRLELRAEPSGVTLSVDDQGIGLPHGAEEQIFRPFGRAVNATTQNLPGMGLGLYISRQIVEAHGGRISAASAGEGRGTTFTIWLPALAELAPEVVVVPEALPVEQVGD